MQQNEKCSRIVLVDDDPIVRDALRQVLLAKNYDVVAVGINKDEAVALYGEHKPDVMLMDIRMEGGTGLDAAKEILEKDSAANILLLTTFHDKEYIDESIKLGCKGYILKENIMAIDSSIDAVLSGKIVFDSKILETIASGGLGSVKLESSAGDEEFLKELSESEQAVLNLVAEGMNNKEIADYLCLSEGTVRNYISSMLSKLELRDRTQLAVYYLKSKNK